MSDPNSKHALVFGGFGAIGCAVVSRLRSDGFQTTATSRSVRDDPDALIVDIDQMETLADLARLPRLDAVVWAQGVSCNDTVADFEATAFESVLRANCTSVALTLRELLRFDRLQTGARLCVISSIWQDQSRQGRFSYSISKAAVGGLVRSAAIDLAERGILVNAVLPGSVDGPMADRPGSSASVFASWTPHGKTMHPDDVADLVLFLCSERNRAVTGQSIPVDLGALTSLLA